MKKFFFIFGIFIFAINSTFAAKYIIDTKGSHAFIHFKIKHLGYSWLYGRFNKFEGYFTFDKNNINDSKVNVTINMNSVDSNHTERDIHLRGKDFFDVANYPTATFTSTSFKMTGKDSAKLNGNLTLHGVTKPITIHVQKIGEGDDPWGGYRMGFEGTTKITLKDFKIAKDLGPNSQQADVTLSIEGIRE